MSYRDLLHRTFVEHDRQHGNGLMIVLDGMLHDTAGIICGCDDDCPSCGEDVVLHFQAVYGGIVRVCAHPNCATYRDEWSPSGSYRTAPGDTIGLDFEEVKW